MQRASRPRRLRRRREPQTRRTAGSMRSARGAAKVENHIIDEYVRSHRPARVHQAGHGGGTLAADDLVPGRRVRRRRTKDHGPGGEQRGGTARRRRQRPGAGRHDRLGIDRRRRPRSTRSWTATTGGLARARADGRVPVCVDENKQLTPWLAESWTSNADASEWTFKIRQGVKFNDGTPMTAKDVAASINRAGGSRQQVERAVGVHRRALEGRGDGLRRRRTVGVQARRAERLVPVLPVERQLQRDHPAGGPTPASSTKTFPGTGPWKLDSYTGGRRARRSSATTTTGARRRIPDSKLEITFYADEAAQILALQGGQLDVVQQFSVVRRPGDARRPGRTRSSSCSRRRTASCRCAPTRSRSTTSACARRWRSPIDRQAHRRRPVPGQVRPRQRQAVRARVPADRHERRRSASRTSTKAKALLAEAGVSRTASSRAGTSGRHEVPEYAQIVRSTRRRRSASSIKLNGRRRPARTTATPCSASRPGSTRSWASSTTATAACRTCSSTRRCTSDGTWNAAHYKNPAYDKLVEDYIAAVDIGRAAAAARRSRRCCSTRRRSSSPTSTTSSRRRRAGVARRRTTAMGHIWRRPRPVARLRTGRARRRRRRATAHRDPLHRPAARPRAHHAVVCQRAVFFGTQVLPGNVGRGDPRAVRSPRRSTRSTRSSAPTSRC